MREGRDLIMPECGDAMSGGAARGLLMSLRGVREFLPRMLTSRQVLLLSVLLADTMGMSGALVQFIGALMVRVMRSVVIAFGHNLRGLHLPRLVVGLPGKFVSVVRVFQRPLRMPALGCLIAFFVVFRSRAMGLGRKVMLRGGAPVFLVRGFLLFVGHGFLLGNSFQASCVLFRRIALGGRAMRYVRVSVAVRRVPMQRSFKPCRSRGSSEIARQNLTIRRIAAVEFPIGIRVGSQCRAFQRDAGEQSACAGI